VPQPHHRPSGLELIGFLAGLLAFGVAGIDMVLPSFSALREGFGLPPDSNRVALVVTAFFLGMATGPIPIGALADRWGRRPALWLSIAIFCAGTAVSPFADGLNALLATRFLAGLGAAGTRVVALAILRDRFQGDDLGRQLSSMVGMFLLSPIVATIVGAVTIRYANWQTVFALGTGFGALMFLWSLRVSETLDPDHDRPNVFAIVPDAARRMAQRVDVVAPLLAVTALQTTLSIYLGSTELLVSDIFGRPGQFPAVFVVVSMAMSVSAFATSRLVTRYGIHRFLGPASLVHLVLTASLLIVTVVSDQQPGFWIFIVLFGLSMAAHLLLIPNLNTLILQPLPDVAGTVAALSTSFLIAGGALLGAAVDARLGDRVTPVVAAMAGVGVVQTVLIRVTLRHTDRQPALRRVG
jgi:DHA1 family bicyclomycin/chloramphenicol resistance-like MFS transporter